MAEGLRLDKLICRRRCNKSFVNRFMPQRTLVTVVETQLGCFGVLRTPVTGI